MEPMNYDLLQAAELRDDFEKDTATFTARPSLTITPSVKTQLIALAVALLTGQLRNAEAIAQTLEILAAQIRNS